MNTLSFVFSVILYLTGHLIWFCLSVFAFDWVCGLLDIQWPWLHKLAVRAPEMCLFLLLPIAIVSFVGMTIAAQFDNKK